MEKLKNENVESKQIWCGNWEKFKVTVDLKRIRQLSL